MVLESPSERVRLLRVGIPGKKIEQMYIELNKFHIVDTCKGFHDDYGLREFIEDAKRNHQYGH